MGDLEWTNDLVIRLMQEYRKRPELWDAKHEMYRVHTLKYETWRELATMFECDIADLRKKLNSLFASHRREKAKIRAGGRSSWFLYPYMAFLPTHLDCADYGGEQQDITTQTAAKRRPPVREVEPPSSSEEEEDDETGVDIELGNHSVQEEVLVKTEPRVRQAQTIRERNHATHKPRLTRPIKRRIIRDRDCLDSRLAETLKLLRKAESTRKKDECDSFGEYIADSLRKHDDRTQSMIKQAINNILFEQEMKKYSTQYTVVISGIDENPLILSGEPEPEPK